MIALWILSPFVAAWPAAWFGGRFPRRAWMLAVWPALISVLLSRELVMVFRDGPRAATLDWAPSLGLQLAFNFDGLGLLFALLISVIGTFVVLYGAAYLEDDPRAGRFFASLFAFMGSMLGVALSDNLFALFVFWELTGFTSFMLIGFNHEDRASRAAAIQALIVTGAGGIALFAAAVLLSQVSGGSTLSAIVRSGMDIRGHALYPGIAALVMLAAFTKSAQVPFHFWLPGAMAAPTPVSAYLHSATMVKAGVYLLARMTPVLGGTTFWMTTLTLVGAITMAGGAWRSVRESDLKRVLAYSTVSALGAMVLMIGIGTIPAVFAALTYLLAHACYKGTLFMVAGGVDHATGTRDVAALGGLRRVMPRTSAAAILAAASMMGLPLFLGFLAKELFYESVMHHARWAWPLTIAAVGSSALLGASGLIAGLGPFAGSRREGLDHAHDPAWQMWVGPMCLSLAGIAFFIPGVATGVLGLAVDSVVPAAPSLVAFGYWHGFTPVLLASVITIAASVGLYAGRDRLRAFTLLRSLGSDRLFTGTIRLVDRVSEVISPPLQSASLRSYVLVLLLTTVTMVGLALFLGGGGWTIARTTDVRPHEVLIALIICCGAISAARAKSSMTAVISLGAVGYGVALLFVFFGAPDLAMTQFSVETLTVVIFVLVFRHFGDFGSLTGRAIRWRDAIVAGAFGAIVSTLVLLVGAKGNASRLSEFFAEAGPTLAHGRNIVNVILVDFRAFDTMGEITVLAVAAIGVHAVLRITSDDRRRP